MKIGILTLPLHTNIGGILQAYALQKIVNDLGHDVETIDLSPTRSFGRFFLLKRCVLKYIFGKKNLDINIKKNTEIIFKQRTQNTERFIQKYIKRRILDSYGQIKSKDYDMIIVGSDQIWRPKYCGKIENSFLDFAVKWKLKRIAYAVSFGTDKWEYTEKQTKICSNLAKFFDAVSVREDSAVELCRKYLGVESIHVLDPTMLVPKDSYKKLVPSEYLMENKQTLMYYVLDKTSEKLNICKQISSKLGLEIDDKTIEFENDNVPIEQRIQIPVEEWISGFVNADFIFTDSFHGCVFSIIFNKPFIVYINEDRGSGRFKSLLKIFDLEYRQLSKNNNIDSILSSKIDWNKVNNILKNKKDLSFRFLNNSIK